MLTRVHRFHGYNSLRYVYRHGRVTRGPLFSLKSIANPRRENYRLAVVVSRKVHKSAVARNRMRRRLYESFKKFEGEISQPHDIVLTVFHDAVLDESPKSLSRQMKKQLEAANIIKK
jgi:ribonuclease P protein component